MGSTRTYVKRKNDGLCPSCGAQPGLGKIICVVCASKQRDRSRRWRNKIPGRAYAAHSKYTQRLQYEFVTHYGNTYQGTFNGMPCTTQECRPEALTVGHLFNDGYQHKVRLGMTRLTAREVIKDLKRRGWPQDEGIAPQCGSCQLIDFRRYLRKPHGSY